MRRPLAFAANRLRAFTLIELLVVIVILGILMAVAVPTFLRQQSKAQDSRTQQYLTTAYKAIRSGTPDTGNQYPTATSMVSWVQQSEPELTVQRASCYTGSATAPTDAVLVDPASTGNSLLLCARSASGNVWELSATATGAPSLINGTLVPLTFSGNEITDATRTADVQGDGLSNDSSTGIWEGTTNLVANGGAESGPGSGWIAYSTGGTLTQDTSTALFGHSSFKATYNNDGSGTFGMHQTWSFGSGGFPAATVGQTYTFSGWLKATPGFVGKTIRVLLRFSGGANPQSQVTTALTLTSSWTRWTATNTVDYSDRTQVDVFIIQNATPVSGEGFWADGLQLEQKAYSTPYVDTSSVSKSRSDASVQMSSSLLNTAQGWFAMRFRAGDPSVTGSGSVIFYADNSNFASDYFDLYYNSCSGTCWRLRRRNDDGSGAGTDLTVSEGTINPGDLITVIGTWTASAISISVNGSPFTSGANNQSAHTSPATTFIGGKPSTGLGMLDGDVFWVACGVGTLSNADAATINSWGNTDPTRANFPSAAQVTMTWDGTSPTGSLK